MKSNDRIRAYAGTKGIETVGSFKSNSTKKKLVGKLTPRQKRRIRKKDMVAA